MVSEKAATLPEFDVIVEKAKKYGRLPASS